MKNKINILLFLVLVGTSATILAQDVDENTIIPLEIEIVPTAVKNAVETDFPNYSATSYSGIPREKTNDGFVEESEGGLIDDFEGLIVNLKREDNELMATYTFEGKLLDVLSDKPNDSLSPTVSKKIATGYPGWEVVHTYRQLIGNTNFLFCRTQERRRDNHFAI